jgi:methylglutaconyl-CoA hydratase
MNNITYEVKNRIASITLNRPEKRNALSYELVSELKSAFQAAGDDKNVKVIILKAEGKAFCAGADLAYLQSLQSNTYEENLADSRHLKELFEKIYTLPKVVIAQVQGHALAGGCGLATVCDLVFSAPEAKYGYTEVKIGFIPAIVKVFLIRKIGEAKAKQLLLTGDLISATEAKEMGMVNYLVAADELSSSVQSMAEKLCTQNSAQSMGTTKIMIAKVQELPVNEALEYAAEMNAKGRATEDCKKGIAAFLNKEDLSW